MPWAARPRTREQDEEGTSPISSWADGERPYPWYGSVQATNIQANTDDPESALFASVAPPPDRHRTWTTRVLESCTTTVVLVGTVLVLIVLSVTLVFAIVKGSRRSLAHSTSSSSSSSSLSHLTYTLPTGLPTFSGFAWIIPTPMGCLEALCEDKMADLGKNFTNSNNMQLLDCIQRTGMDNTAGRSCFVATPPGVQRDALYKCSVCKGCIPALPKEKDTLCLPDPPANKTTPAPAKPTGGAPHAPATTASASTIATTLVAQPVT